MKRKLLLIIVLIVSAMQTQAQDMKNHNFEVAKNLDVFNYIYKYLGPDIVTGKQIGRAHV